jgi:ACT domain-containing protein
MTILKNGDTINKTEKRVAKHASRTTIETSVDVTRKDRYNQMTTSVEKTGTKILTVTKKATAKLSWT